MYLDTITERLRCYEVDEGGGGGGVNKWAGG